jgi:YHS domain-containing protein
MSTLPKRLLIPAALILAIAPCFAQARAAIEALDGLDPVMLVQGKEVAGKPDLALVRGGFAYFFSSADTRAAFEREPERYEIQLGGLCARMGRTAGGNPSDYVVHNGRIYIFGSDDCHKKFEASPAKYLPPPTAPMPASADALADGRRLLDRAVRALGGAARLDALTTYRETASHIQKRGQDDVPVSVTTMWRFPGEARAERTITLPGKTSSSAMLLTPDGAWFIAGPDRAFRQMEAARPAVEQDFGRNPVVLLRTRNEKGFSAAALGRDTSAGVAIDRVRVRRGSIDVVLGLDPETGRIQTATYSDRNQVGEYGIYTLRYGDYRLVDGLTVPFTIRAAFNADPDESQSWALDSVALDPVLDPSLFTPPTSRQ